jgi:hypothetical protein
VRVSEYEDVIGGMARASDLAAELPPAEEAEKREVLPVATCEELERPSPKPFVGRADLDYPELDSLDPLYIPRFLIRKWGAEKFERSAYRAHWREAVRSGKQLVDAKPSERKK